MDRSSETNREILDSLADLNGRISRIESYLDLSSEEYDQENNLEKKSKKTEEEKKSLEFEIGQFWFAKAGIVVLAIGIAIILTLPFDNFPPVIPSLFGFTVSLVLFGFSKLWKNSFNLISRYLYGSGFLLLFFSILRLHYWGDPSFITNNFYEFILLALISLILLFISIRKESTYLFNIGLTLVYGASLVSGETYIIFISVIFFTALSSYIKINYDWGRLFYYSVFLTYFTHFIWFINDPLIIGNKIQFMKEPYLNIFFLMFYLVVIAVGNIFRK